MRDRIFIDTNILIYSISKNCQKCEIARQILIDNADLITLSSQVINEFINVCIKKKILSEELTFMYANEFMDIFDFYIISKKEIRLAISIKQRYGFSYWDSLIIASALESGSSVLYTEDLHHNQKIENSLKIINPFAKRE
ncbi:MAG TPA: PIN domain-containing protein [Persephonella sp.]|uniref:PIN domain protein n=1 Tax=Persephonella marina (strain DSM 14350 / EX-H1) TaxID=123214 RepID=C0QRU5_PERMH|nr:MULTISPECIES: PIN domain-containing protein [Persephonella]ACO02966.1 PIN domain protein [Persephonella marina EX-H1]HCB69136.1 PIN domain-containing protein [Persephonella sp.]